MKFVLFIVAAMCVALTSCAVSTPWGSVSVAPAASLDINVE